jgi:hypothetical protein
MPTTPSERRLQASIAADTKWALTDDRTAATEAARTAALARFETRVDPERTLPPAERHERAVRLMRAHMRALALKSAKARRAKAEAKAAGR